MSTYSKQINTILRDRLLPKMCDLSMEVARIEPYSYSNTRLEESKRQLDYLSMLYDFLYEYTVGTEELENGKLVNVVRLIEPPGRERKSIELLRRTRTETKLKPGYRLYINNSEVTPGTIITPGQFVTITAEYTPVTPITTDRSITITVLSLEGAIVQTSSGFSITVQNKEISLASGGGFLIVLIQPVVAFGAPIAPSAYNPIPIDTIADSTFYYGVGAQALNVPALQSLTVFYEPRSSKTLRFSPTNQVMYFAYPLNYGELTSIIDPNGFDITSDFIHTDDKVFTLGLPNGGATGIYHVYEFNNLTTQVDYDITFNF